MLENLFIIISVAILYMLMGLVFALIYEACFEFETKTGPNHWDTEQRGTAQRMLKRKLSDEALFVWYCILYPVTVPVMTVWGLSRFSPNFIRFILKGFRDLFGGYQICIKKKQ